MDPALMQSLPDMRDEAWRYAPLRSLLGQALAPSSVVASASDKALSACLPQSLAGFTRVVVVDGRVRASLSDPSSSATAAGVAPTPVANTPPAAAATATDHVDTLANNGLARINHALAPELIDLSSPGAATPLCLQVVFVSTSLAAEGASLSRLQLRVAAGQECALVEQHVSLADTASFVNHHCDVRVAAGARLRWTRVIGPSVDTCSFETLRISLDTNAQCDFLCVAAGQRAYRGTVSATLGGVAAELRHAAVALGNGAEHLDQHVYLRHAAARVTSQQTYRSIAAGRSRIAFTGHNHVLAEARGASTQQSLRNLLSGDVAEAIARPQLEILTDEVRAAHGATTGSLDAQMLFYLLSRGLDKDTAQRLLKWAFLEDVIRRVEPPPLRQAIESLLLTRLQDPLLDAWMRERGVEP
jgi:Fe-S cluster assembly protein SufD